MVVVELKYHRDKVEWWTLRSGGIPKEVAGGVFRNGEGGGKFSIGDIAGKTEVYMEASAPLKVFCENIRMTGKTGYPGNKTGKERVVEFGNIIGKTTVYTKFGHM